MELLNSCRVYPRIGIWSNWSIGACRLFYSLWLKATEQSTCTHTSYFSTLQKISHLQGAIFTITQLPFVKHWQEPEYFNHFVSSCILKVTTDFFLLHSQVWQMFHNDNGCTELAIGWNSTELGDLLKAKFLNFQTR